MERWGMMMGMRWRIRADMWHQQYNLHDLVSEDLVSVYLPTRSGVLPAISGMINWLPPEILFSLSFSWWIPHSPLITQFLVLNSTITWEYEVRSSLSITPSSQHELPLSTEYTMSSIHRVLHTLRTAYTEYWIHWVLDTPCTAYTKYFIHWVLYTPSTSYTE